ncbi:MAG: exodeoxyribonuclease VII small subunit [Alphaproteobacteria bacterium]|nr:exodeoxyribonuclease VII small subunit [Alphaproteobacteria bacterium]
MPKAAETEPAIAAMNFEQAMAALEEIVQKLEGSKTGLEESIALYARGTALKQHCEAKLKAAQAQVEKIVLTPAGEPVGTEPIDPA